MLILFRKYINRCEHLDVLLSLRILTGDHKQVQAIEKTPTIFNHRQLANFVTAVITWVHYFKSVITIQNNICLIKHDRSPEVANDSTK